VNVGQGNLTVFVIALVHELTGVGFTGVGFPIDGTAMDVLTVINLFSNTGLALL
jgi:hypothetical protein